MRVESAAEADFSVPQVEDRSMRRIGSRLLTYTTPRAACAFARGRDLNCFEVNDPREPCGERIASACALGTTSNLPPVLANSFPRAEVHNHRRTVRARVSVLSRSRAGICDGINFTRAGNAGINLMKFPAREPVVSTLA